MLTKTEIQEFVKNNYEIICNEIKQLHGYVDKNFYLKEEGSNAEYVLRITPEDNFNESNMFINCNRMFLLNI